MATAAEEQRAILLRGDDNVAVAARPIPKGFVLDGRRPGRSRSASRSRSGTRSRWPTSPPGEPVRKYGQIIGFASKAIPAGALGPRPQRQGRPVRARLRLRHRAPAGRRRRSSRGPFQGYPPARRPGRHAELRRRHQHGQLLGEHVAVHRRAVPRRRLADATSRTSTASSRSRTRGAAPCRSAGPTTQTLERVLAGFANHPNVAAYVLVGLGCEVSFAQHLVETQDLVTLGGGQGQRRQGRAGPAAGAQHPGARRDRAGRSRRRSQAVHRAPARGQLAGRGPSSRRRRSAWRWSAAARTATRA